MSSVLSRKSFSHFHSRVKWQGSCGPRIRLRAHTINHGDKYRSPTVVLNLPVLPLELQWGASERPMLSFSPEKLLGIFEDGTWVQMFFKAPQC